MTKLNKSPTRGLAHTVRHKNKLIENPTDLDSLDMLDFYEKLAEDQNNIEDTSEWKLNNLEYDLRTSEVFQTKCNEDSYAQNLYAALCNNEFIKNEVVPILTEEIWTCSWRHAGGIISDIREQGDYMDWYCSGIRSDNDNDLINHVAEGVVTDEIKKDLFDLGWIVAKNG